MKYLLALLLIALAALEFFYQLHYGDVPSSLAPAQSQTQDPRHTERPHQRLHRHH